MSEHTTVLLQEAVQALAVRADGNGPDVCAAYEAHVHQLIAEAAHPAEAPHPAEAAQLAEGARATETARPTQGAAPHHG